MSLPPVLVSLAVISQRLPALEFVIASLLEQTLSPAKVMLAISPEPYLLDAGVRPDDLPAFVRREIESGRVELMVVPNIGSYRKLMPVLERAAGTPTWVATADDDVLYPPRWLEGLYRAAAPTGAIAAYRARVARVEDGRLTPYESWPLLHRDKVVDQTGGLGIFPTGRGGVLYRTDAFPSLAIVEALRRLAPAQDDLAFRVATLLTRTPVVPVPPSDAGAGHWEFPSAMGPTPGLYDQLNASGANDEALATLAQAVRSKLDLPALLTPPVSATSKPAVGFSFSNAGLTSSLERKPMAVMKDEPAPAIDRPRAASVPAGPSEPSEAPLLSICVPTFNRRALLERNVTFHLESFSALGIPFEIVIADDCSTDGTADYLASLSGEPRVRAIRRARNSGFLDNYAFVMRRARGKYAIFLGDDDLLIPETVVDYIGRMEADPSLGMVQAPWLMMDERPGGGPIGPFYRIPGETRFARGAYQPFLQFLFDHHVFPEFMIIRRDILAGSISSACPFIFWAFLYTARALAHADILFIPEPFARVTAVSSDPRTQQGNSETMFQWDRYRGGIEYVASLAFPDDRTPATERKPLVDHINRFMHIRQSVALRLLIGAQHWAEAYILHHRLAAYGASPLNRAMQDKVRTAAAFATAAEEAASYAAGPVVLDPAIDGALLEALKPAVKARLSRAAPAEAATVPLAFLRLDPAFPPALKADDAVFDVREYLAQFV
ncbi:glycosyltransferase family 2 protein [Chthonobacter rhizosphaerae]|uniref:glycosyltransferase family 2 protein n=1 Tax=Chthonobacter rhizosphaerae TaxID=2735553 RepID=UPI0015EE4039|nr:glycosyltransferase family 2 protein [Chthonobacter rhizosphaerae]